MLKTIYWIYDVFKNQWSTPKEHEKLRTKRLQKAIRFAYETSPYYQKLFVKNKILPESIKTFQDLKKIPLTTKEDIQNNQKLFLSTKARNVKEHRTSGSSGLPLKIYLNSSDIAVRKATYIRARNACGFRIGDKEAMVRTYHDRDNHKWHKIFSLYRETNILAESSMNEKLSQLIDLNPDVITAYPSEYLLFCNEIKKNPNIVKKLKPRLLTCGAETLTDNAREKITETFGLDLFNFYGSEEFSAMAFECSKHGFHYNSDIMHFEFLKNGKYVKEGEMGEIVVTRLLPHATPLIRYRIKDIAEFTNKQCPCGRSLLRLQKLYGRSNDFITLPSGGYATANYFDNIMQHLNGIDSYKIVQEDLHHITIFVQKNKEYKKSLENKIIKKFKDIDKNIKYKIKYTKIIKQEKSGKLRIMISKVKVNFT